ncbi:hypothetical protein L596_004512 [Steinernema carpocapsae]|uniref:Uncharacterized protein n=1 Tax=Steinernema carpocapsae TaxID=34508 RepID=A0A4U8UW55_STECR|nr:hypothetical protein L596_004512 [Steinernema carpocapsae]
MTELKEAATPYLKLEEENDEKECRGIENKTFGMDDEPAEELPKKDHLKLPSPGGGEFIKTGTTFEVSKNTSTSTHSINMDAENATNEVKGSPQPKATGWQTKILSEKTRSIGKSPSFNIFNSEDILCPFGKRRYGGSSEVEESTCCLISSKLLSIVFVVAGILLASICITYTIYHIQKMNINGSNKDVIICLVSGCTVYFLSSVGFLYGTLWERRRFMLPHIFFTVIFCVATIGAFVSMAITMIWDVEEQMKRAKTVVPENVMAQSGEVHVFNSNEAAFKHSVAEMVIFRVTVVLSVIYQSMTCICYLKTYNYLSRLSRASHS